MIPVAEYSRGINSSSLILTADKEYGLEKDSMEMFRYNEIPYFLKMNMMEKSGRKQFCYDITGRRSLDQLLEYKLLDGRLLLKILNSLDQACIQAASFMLGEDDILLKPEMIFLENESDTALYCYLPGNQEDICGQFQELMEYLLQHLDHKNEQAVQLAYGVYQRVAEEKAALHSVLGDFAKGNMEFKAERQTEEENLQNPLKNMSSVQEAVRIPAETMLKAPVSRQPVQTAADQQTGTVSRQPVQTAADQQAGTVSRQPVQTAADQQAGTVSRQFVQAAAGQPPEEGKKREQPKLKQKEVTKKQTAGKLKNLLRKKLYTSGYRNEEEEQIFEEETEEMPVINHTVCMMTEADSIQKQFIYQGVDRTKDFYCMDGRFILGSSEECDICIQHPMISRVHARIEINTEGTFLEDMNSTNGTQINGELLKYKEKYMLKKGDIISLAGENYSFH